jgi:hypothetical protein
MALSASSKRTGNASSTKLDKTSKVGVVVVDLQRGCGKGGWQGGTRTAGLTDADACCWLWLWKCRTLL